MKFIFWFSIIAIIYAYIGYPFLLYLLSIFRKKVVQRDDRYCPHVSLIITVHNEQDRIKEKIVNTLALDYPQDRLEVIFASDASTDKTEDIVQSYKQFKLVRSPIRRGKEFAQKCAIDQAAGEIFVFSDVATMLKPEGLRTITANFADPTVGCVSSEDRFLDEKGKVCGEGAYVKYEMFLRRLETQVNSLVGLSGSFFAARRTVCSNWAVDLQSDFNTVHNSLRLGLRGISDHQSIGFYRNISDEKKEFNRKVRTVLRGLSVMKHNLGVLNINKYGLFSWQLFSHKICRWLVPFFLALCFIANLFILKDSIIYMLLFGFQIIFYLMTLLFSEFGEKLFPFLNLKTNNNNFLLRYNNLLKIPHYFVVVNAAIIIAWIKFFKGEQSVFWEPSKR